MGLFSRFKRAPADEVMEEASEEGYVELDTEGADEDSKIVVKPYVISEFEHVKEVLDDLREGHTLALINIKPLKDKDIVELKRAINKLKKTCDAIEGDIAGFGEDWIAAVPSFAHIHRAKSKAEGEKVPEVTEFSE